MFRRDSMHTFTKLHRYRSAPAWLLYLRDLAMSGVMLHTGACDEGYPRVITGHGLATRLAGRK
jgi:hypothetical protein